MYVYLCFYSSMYVCVILVARNRVKWINIENFQVEVVVLYFGSGKLYDQWIILVLVKGGMGII